MELTRNIECMVELPLDFSVSYLESGNLLWTRGQEKGVPCGTTCKKYAHNGTLQKVRLALLDALAEVDAETSLWSDHGN